MRRKARDLRKKVEGGNGQAKAGKENQSSERSNAPSKEAPQTQDRQPLKVSSAALYLDNHLLQRDLKARPFLPSSISLALLKMSQSGPAHSLRKSILQVSQPLGAAASEDEELLEFERECIARAVAPEAESEPSVYFLGQSIRLLMIWDAVASLVRQRILALCLFRSTRVQ